MKIRANINGELNVNGQNIHWVHKEGDVKEFSEEVGETILTNNNYEKVGKKPASKKEDNFGKDGTSGKEDKKKETEKSKKEFFTGVSK